MSLNLDKSTWTRVTFDDAIESVTDRVDNPSEAGVDRYVGLEHLDPGVMTVQRWDSPDKVEAQKLRFQPGDVIFGRRRAYQKKVARADFEGICSAHALVLRAKQDHIHPDFLPVFLSSDYFLDRAISISVGSLSPTVNWRDLRVQEFDLPPLDEQKRIADLLWAVEDHSALVRSTQAHAQTTFRSALAEKCDPHASDAVPLNKVTEILDNMRVPLNSTERSGRQGNVPYYGAAGKIDSIDSAIFDEKLVLIAEDGAGLSEWHKRPIAYLIDGPSWVNNHAHVIRPTRVSHRWLLYSLMHYDLTPHIAVGTRPKLNLSELKKMRVRHGETAAIEEGIIRTIDETRHRLASEIATLRSLRRALMDSIFGGN